MGVLLFFSAACQSQPTPTPFTQVFVTNTAVPTLSPATETAVFTHTPIPPTHTTIVIDTIEPYPVETTTSEGSDVFLPVVSDNETTATPIPSLTATPAPTNTATPTPIPTVDFTAVAAQLDTQGQDLAFVKIGFHVGVGGNSEGLTEWMTALDAAGVPFFLKSVDNAQPILFAQELMKASGVPHTLVFRATGKQGYDYDVPNYTLSAQEAARIHWQAHLDVFPPELDPAYIWLETINEVDKNRAEWLGQFSLATAELALRDGYKWAAFGWASGEPEPFQWETPAMLAYLRLAGQYPDQLAVALHEYSYINENIGDAYPYKVGRFQALFEIADAHNIPRPTVLITEWGWTYQSLPDIEDALADVAWSSRLYAPYPQVKGAAIWYLGNGFERIADEAQLLIRPLTQYALTTYFPISDDAANAPIQPELYAP